MRKILFDVLRVISEMVCVQVSDFGNWMSFDFDLYWFGMRGFVVLLLVSIVGFVISV